MTKFFLEILTPEKTFFEGEIDHLTVETPEGQLGFLANHAPIAVGLEPAIITMKTDGKEKIAVNGEGFLLIKKNKTTILCQTMEWPEEIEPNRIQRKIEEEERKLREAKSAAEYKLSKAAIARAFARSRALRK